VIGVSGLVFREKPLVALGVALLGVARGTWKNRVSRFDSCLVKNLAGRVADVDGSRLILTALSRTSPLRVVRNAG